MRTATSNRRIPGILQHVVYGTYTSTQQEMHAVRTACIIDTAEQLLLRSVPVNEMYATAPSHASHGRTIERTKNRADCCTPSSLLPLAFVSRFRFHLRCCLMLSSGFISRFAPRTHLPLLCIRSTLYWVYRSINSAPSYLASPSRSFRADSPPPACTTYNIYLCKITTHDPRPATQSATNQQTKLSMSTNQRANKPEIRDQYFLYFCI